MNFKDKVVVVTGGALGIGKGICEAFKKQGAHVCIIDVLDNEYYVGSIGSKKDIDIFVKKIIDDYGHVDYIINNAKPLFKGIDECSYEEFNEALQVGVTGPFWLVKCLKDYLNEGASIVNISSSRDRMSQPQSESYTAAKGGIASLTHSLAVSLAGKARVNSVSPGWIDTTGHHYQGSDAMQHLVKRVGTVDDIVHTVMFLCSDESGFITGENICVDGGMTKLMIYHDDYGWSFHE